MSCENCGKEGGVRVYRRYSDGWVVPISLKVGTPNGVCLWSMDAKGKFLPMHTCHPALQYQKHRAFATDKTVICGGANDDEKWEYMGV